MKAAIFHGPNQPLSVEEITTPEPGAGDVLVKVAACGVCHTDLHYIDHGTPTFKEPPLVLGHEASGTVAALGAGVEDWSEGDRVLLPAVVTCGECRFCRTGRENICERMIMFGNHVDGAYAEYVIAPAKDIFYIPDKLDLKKASIIADAVSTPYHAVKNRGEVRPGDTVAVLGCGGVGMNVVQVAAATGAYVYAIDVEPSKLELAQSLGAHRTVNPTEDENFVKTVKKETGGGVDVAFEAIGNPVTISQGYALIRKGGRLVVIGYTDKEVTLSPARLMFFELEIVGSLGCRPVDYPPLIRMAAEGTISLDPLISDEYGLEEINDAFDVLREGKAMRSLIVP